MEKKYELLKDDYKDIDGQRVYRIRALKDFMFDLNDSGHYHPGVRKGMRGGYIQSESNLSHEGDCWVGDPGAAGETIVYGGSVVEGNGWVGGNLIVKNSRITGFADGNRSVIENSQILERAWVHNFNDGKIIGSTIRGNAEIWCSGNILHSVISGDAKIEGARELEIYGSGINGNASVVAAGVEKGFIPKVYNSFLEDHAMVRENAKVVNSTVSGHGYICGNADVRDSFVNGSGSIGGDAVAEDAVVVGKALVYGDAVVRRSKIQDNARVYRMAVVEDSVIAGNAIIQGDAVVRNYKLKDIHFTRSVDHGIYDAEQAALSMDAASEKHLRKETCYIAQSMKHRTEADDGSHVSLYVVYTKEKDNSLAGYKENVLAFCDTLEEAKREAGENGYTNIVVENTEKKYELATDEAPCIMFNKKHYRIRALRDIEGVPAGRIGGYVESEDNLSHDGNCWVAHDALVSGNARVEGDAIVCGRATVMDNAVIKGKAMVSAFASVAGNAVVGESGYVASSAIVMDDAKILSHAFITGEAVIGGKSLIGEATIRDKALVMDSKVWGGSVVGGRAVVIHGAVINNGMKLSGEDYAEGKNPVRQQNMVIADRFRTCRSESQRKIYVKRKDTEKQKKPNVRK